MTYVRPVIEITGGLNDEDLLLGEEMGWGWKSIKKVAGKSIKVATKAAIAPVTMPSKVTARVVAKAAPKVLPKPLARAATKATAFTARASEAVARAPITVAQKASGPALAVANQIKKYGLKVALAPVLALFWQAVNKRQRAGEPNRARAAQWVAHQVKAKLGPLGTVFVFLLKQAGTSVSGSYVGADPVTWGSTIAAASAALAAIMKYVNFAEGIIKTGKKAKQMMDPMIEIMAKKKAEEEAARKRAEEEAARKRAEEEAARKRAEEEAARELAQEIEDEETTAEDAVDEEIEDEDEETTAEDAVEGMF